MDITFEDMVYQIEDTVNELIALQMDCARYAIVNDLAFLVSDLIAWLDTATEGDRDTEIDWVELMRSSICKSIEVSNTIDAHGGRMQSWLEWCVRTHGENPPRSNELKVTA